MGKGPPPDRGDAPALAGRQHRRSYQGVFDCAFALQELQNMGVDNVVTFDAQHPGCRTLCP